MKTATVQVCKLCEGNKMNIIRVGMGGGEGHTNKWVWRPVPCRDPAGYE